VEHPTLSLQSNRKKMDSSAGEDQSGPDADDLVYYNEKENRLVIREVTIFFSDQILTFNSDRRN
jgi:hypothetical protein